MHGVAAELGAAVPNIPPAKTAGRSEAAPTIAIQPTYQVIGVNPVEAQRQAAVDHISAWTEEAFEQAGHFTVLRDVPSANASHLTRILRRRGRLRG